VKNNLALIVATKDRPGEVKKLLDSLNTQTLPPAQLIIVDGGTIRAEQVIRKYPNLNIRYFRCSPPSAAKQRNIGVKAAPREANLIGFLDDDTTLPEKSMEEMMNFWENVDDHVGGAAFNLLNSPPLYASRLKSISLVKKLGLYSNKIGAVLPSGFQTVLNSVSENTAVEWISTCGAVWRRRVFDDYRFDEWYEGYSYLEDLDFSYRVGREYELVVVAKAKFYHYPAATGRDDGEKFGRREVANRIYFVKKNKELSLTKCYLAIFIRILISLIMGVRGFNAIFFERIIGNIKGLFDELKKALILKWG
jgi:GT2 family glycosyltransferase